jgi:hypothetical protein
MEDVDNSNFGDETIDGRLGKGTKKQNENEIGILKNGLVLESLSNVICIQCVYMFMSIILEFVEYYNASCAETLHELKDDTHLLKDCFGEICNKYKLNGELFNPEKFPSMQHVRELKIRM